MMDETDRRLREALQQHGESRSAGLYGSNLDGKIKTFSRGGSDITGALVARAINADVYENWTDVSGFSCGRSEDRENPKR